MAAVDEGNALGRYPAEVAAMARALVDSRVEISSVCRALGAVHDALVARLLDLAEADLGPPPCAYVWLALGSGGRMEQALYSDQDHALLYADDDTAGEYFSALGARMVDRLASAGLRRCPGGYMADRWHLSLHSWREVFLGWVERPEPQALVEAEVFLDFRRVRGDLPLESLEAVLRRGAYAQRFLVGMARAAVRFPPPLRLLGPVLPHHGEVDVKRAGLAGVVLLARLYALAAGSAARSTPDRLAAGAAAGAISERGAADLTDAYRFLAELRLTAQLRQAAAGRPPTDRVPLADLSADQRSHLRQALRAIRDVQRFAAMRFRTDTVL